MRSFYSRCGVSFTLEQWTDTMRSVYSRCGVSFTLEQSTDTMCSVYSSFGVSLTLELLTDAVCSVYSSYGTSVTLEPWNPTHVLGYWSCCLLPYCVTTVTSPNLVDRKTETEGA